MAKNKQTTDKVAKTDMSKYYKFILYLVVLVLINLVGVTLFFRFDLTSSSLYSLSRASKEAVSSLKEPLTINVFFSKDLPAPYNTIERYLRDLLEEYEIHANKYLSYRFYDVSAKEGDISEEAEENRKRAQSYGIYPVNVQKIAQDETKVQRAYMGMVLIHGDVVEKIPAITSTEGLEYKITNAIKKMNNKISALLDLPEKIKVKLVLSSSIFDIARVININGLDNLKANLEEIVDKLNKKTYGQLAFVHVDPTTDADAAAKIRRYERFGMRWPDITTPAGLSIPAGQAIAAIGMEYGDKSLERQLLDKSIKLTSRGFEEVYSVPEKSALESFINENVDNLIDINEDVGFLSSHGTVELAPELPPQLQAMESPRPQALRNLNRLLRKEYTIKPVDLKKEDAEIPDSIDTLIIAGPKENFSDWELLQLDQFLMKGKSLALFMDAFREIQQRNPRQYFQQPVYLPLNTGLEKLLDHYGVKVDKSYVMDESCFVRRGQQEGEMPFYFAPIIKNENISHDFDFMENIKEMIVVKVSPVQIDEEKIKKNELEADRLLASTEKAWEMKGRINLLPMMISPPSDEKERGQRALAYILTGEFPSYFADKPLPEKPKKEEKKDEDAAEEDNKEKPKEEKAAGEEKPVIKETRVTAEKSILTKGRPGKIFIIGSSEVLKDNMIDEEGQSPNALFLLNMFDFLNNKEEIAVMRGKRQRFNPIKDTKAFTRFFVKWFNIAGLPILFILFGTIVYIRRAARKRTIQQMFKK